MLDGAVGEEKSIYSPRECLNVKTKCLQARNAEIGSYYNEKEVPEMNI